jgi:antitoxin CcdA
MSAAPASAKRRSINLTVREDVIEAAKALGVNASKAAEAGIAEAVRRAREETWLKAARPAIEAHNKRVTSEGPHVVTGWAKPYWKDQD